MSRSVVVFPIMLAALGVTLAGGCGSSADGTTAADAGGGDSPNESPDAGAAALPKCPVVSTTDRAALLARAQTFSERHGVMTTIAFDGCPPHTFVTCEAVTPSDWAGIYFFLDQMDSEMSIYPIDFFATIRLDYFVFGGKLAKNNAEHDSLGGAVVEYGDHRSVLLVNTSATSYCYEPFNKRVAHHEIAHAIDNGFAGATDGNWWSTMNPPGFSYGGVDFHAPDITDITHPQLGLVTKYAGYDVSEDYAEVYTSLHFGEKANDLRAWVAEDQYLRAKLRAVTGALATKWQPLVEALPNHAVAE
jgi:hypothetical protein